MHRPRWRTFTLALILVGLAAPPRLAFAAHEGYNVLEFAPGAASPSPGATGSGVIDFRGGVEPTSKWTISFQFAGLPPDTAYDVAVQGRTGEDGSPEATADSPLCRFRTTLTGDGGCWFYLVGLRRLGAVKLRLDDPTATSVLEATRAAGGPGSITTTPNEESPAEPPAGATPPPAVRPSATPRQTRRGRPTS